MRTALAIAYFCAAICASYAPLVAQEPATAKVEAAPISVAIDFVREVEPILSEHCYDCHALKKRRGGLRLDSKAAALRGGKSGPAVVAGEPERSELVRRVEGLGEKQRMPQGSEPLEPRELEILRRWIKEGAVWPDAASAEDDGDERHWAYVPPVRPPLPKLAHAEWIHNPIDAFVLQKLEEHRLQPSPPADRATLIRRVSLDLIGLPPTPEEVDAFVNDARPDAYERLVDRLFASPHYGERWAIPWLDLARYADTNGYEKDLPRSNWAWRDWVIRALNADLPFDRFTILQLAGDLVSDATLDDQVATGFQRNTLLNDEGGIDAEEFRVVAVLDRANTTATVWLGSTLGCAQCHDHKYDPFTQKDYYSFVAYFDQTEDVGVGFAPTVEVPTDAQRAEQTRLRGAIAELDRALAPPADREDALAWERSLVASSAVASSAAASSAAASNRRGTRHDWILDGAGATKIADTASAPGASDAAPFDGSVTPSDKANFVDSPLGRALALHGDAFVDCGRAASFERDRGFSYGAWVRFDGSGAVLGKIDDPHAYRGFDLFKNQQKLEVHIVHEWPSNGIKVQTVGSVADGEWMHLCVTYDGSSTASGVHLYVDGVGAALETVNDSLSDSIANDVPLKLGSREASGGLSGALREAFVLDRALTPDEVRDSVRASLAPLAAQAFEERGESQRALLERVRIAQDPVLAAKRSERESLARELAALPIATSLVMRERKEPRTTHVLQRGNFRTPGEAVEPRTPDALAAPSADLPRNRLGLARWLVDRGNPLTARVTMNRLWAAFFGTGLVATAEDFGAQGDLPTHAELLDWLAVEFMERGWSSKAMQRLIVTSATYRQSSQVTRAMLEQDPTDRWLERAPRVRLEAEIVRDNALAIAGLLSPKIGGPSVMPPQPAGVWEGSFATHDTPGEKWVDATGEDRWRRGLYTYLRRSAPYPSALTFDASRRDVCVVKRSRTDNPLQALTTLDDPVFVEAALGLAKRMLLEGGATDRERLTRGFRCALARSPRADELERLQTLERRARESFAAAPGRAEAFIGSVPIDFAGLDRLELATLAVVANVLLNLDEVVTRS